jgi:uncharacterized protein (TIGR02996 family)
MEGYGMAHPAEFWQDILARPQDDLPRLRYADWLSGRDQPLADFIRLQCHLAQEPACARRAMEMEAQQQELLADYSALWAGALVDHSSWWSYRRGFVDEISVTTHALATGAGDLFHEAPLEDLHLEPDGTELAQLPSVPELTRTVFLDLSAHPIGDDGVAQLAQAPFLAHVHGLNLTSCGLQGTGLNALGYSPHAHKLRELYLCDNSIDDAGVRQLLLTPLLERLDVLYLRDNPIGDEAAGLLRRIMGARVHL